MIRIFALAGAALLSACATSAEQPEGIRPAFEFAAKDNLASRLFEIRLTSIDQTGLCIPVEQWPAAYGGVDTGSQRAWVLIDDESFPAADDNFGHCPGGCGYIRVEGGKSLFGAIPYAQFEIAGDQIDSPNKRLKYEIFPVRCEKDMKFVTPR